MNLKDILASGCKTEVFAVTDTEPFPDIKALVLIHPDGKTVTTVASVPADVAVRVKAAIGQQDYWDAMKITKRMLEKAEIAVADFLDERIPAAALPGGVQLFASDALDAEFKHEKGCADLALAVLNAALTRTNAKKR